MKSEKLANVNRQDIIEITANPEYRTGEKLASLFGVSRQYVHQVLEKKNIDFKAIVTQHLIDDFLETQEFIYLADEVWKPYEKCVDLEVSDHGRVRGIKYKKIRGVEVPYYKLLHKNFSELTKATRVVFKGKQWVVSRMVAETFVPNPKGGDTVFTVTGDLTNHHHTNLVWGFREDIFQFNKDRQLGANRNLDWHFITPEGKIICVDNLKKFCRDNDLSYQCMRNTTLGLQHQHKGYRHYKKVDKN